MEQTRIGIVMPLGHQLGGAESLLMHLLTHGSKRFALHCLFLEDGPLVERTRALGYPVEVIPTTRLTDPVNFLQSLRRIRKWAKREQLRAAFSWMPKAHLYVAPALAFSSLRLMWFQHGISSGQTMDRLATRLRADAVFCCSGASKAAQDRLQPRRNALVCYPGVVFPAETHTAAEARARLGLPPDTRLVGMVSRWERWKGVHIFLEAIAKIAALEPESSFFLVGGPHPRDPGYAQEIEAMASDLNLGSRLILAGQRPSDEVPLWFAAADLIVHPGTGTEPFGMAVAEAMGMGRTVIASNTGGIPEIIRNGEDGFLVPPGATEELARKMLQLLHEPRLREETGKRACARGRSFSVDRFAERFDTLLVEAGVR